MIFQRCYIRANIQLVKPAIFFNTSTWNFSIL